MSSRCRHGGGGDQIISRSVQKVQPLLCHRLRVINDIHDRRASALLHTAAGFVLQRRDAPLLVAGAWVVIDHLAVPDEIILESIQHVLRLMEHRFIDAAVNQKALRAEHLRNLCQDGGAATGDQHIRKTPDGRIGSDPAQPVRAAAFHADHKLRHRQFHALKLPGICGKLLQQGPCRAEFVLHILAGEELHPVLVIVPQLLQELFMGQVLAAKAQDKHASRIRVADQGCQELPCLRMVMACLAAAKGVREGIQPVHGALHQILVVGHQLLRHVIDASHRGDDPDLIPDRGPSVLTQKALERLRLHAPDHRMRGMIAVLHLTGQVRGRIVGVHPLSRGNPAQRVSDGKTIFDNIFAFADVLQGNLMALRDVLGRRDRQAVYRENRPGLHRLQRYRHIIGRMDPDTDHKQLLKAASAPSSRIIVRPRTTSSSSFAIPERSISHIFSLDRTL